MRLALEEYLSWEPFPRGNQTEVPDRGRRYRPAGLPPSEVSI